MAAVLLSIPVILAMAETRSPEAKGIDAGDVTVTGVPPLMVYWMEPPDVVEVMVSTVASPLKEKVGVAAAVMGSSAEMLLSAPSLEAYAVTVVASVMGKESTYLV